MVPEKAMAPHSSTLAWKIPWMEEPGRLQSMGSLRVGHDIDITFTFHSHFSLSCIGEGMATHSSVLAGESQGRGSLVGCRLWGCTESDTSEVTWQQISGTMQFLSFSAWLISLSIMCSRFIHVLTNGKICFFLMTE